MIKTIASTHIKNKEKELFMIEHDGARIEVEERFSNPRQLVLFVDGAQLGENPPSTSIDTTFNGKSATHHIRIKSTRNKGGLFFINPLVGITIEIDNIPVQGTTADPYTGLKIGRSGIGFFAFIYALKAVFQLAGIMDPSPMPMRAAGSIVYVVPFLVLLVLFFQYKSRPKSAIYIGSILALLECADYAWGIYVNPEQMRNAVSILIFGGLRISSLLALFKAFRSLQNL